MTKCENSTSNSVKPISELVEKHSEMNINLHIERLILDGLPIEGVDGGSLRIAIEGELTRLLTQSGGTPSLQTGTSLPSVRGDSIQLVAQSSPAQLGRQIAGSVHNGINKIV